MSRPKYSETTKHELVKLARAGESPDQLAARYPPSAQSIRNWLRRADGDESGNSSALNSTERTEHASLRRELARLREENELLKKIGAWFAPTVGAHWAKRSNS